MPPDRKVPEMSRALAADTGRTPQPTTHNATTPNHNHRAYAMSSDHRQRVAEGSPVTRVRPGSKQMCGTHRIIGDKAPSDAARCEHAN